MQGCFIVIEGADGAGTSTQVHLLAEWLRARGIAVLEEHEPTSRPVGELIRSMLRGRVELPWDATALLFAADRIDHCRNVIQPTISRGTWVLSDRYTLSSYIYQTLAHCEACKRTEPSEWVLGWLKQLNMNAEREDLNVILKVSPEVAKQRRMMRAGAQEFFEEDAFQAAVCRAYANPRDWGARNFQVIDGEEPVPILHERIVKLVEPYVRTGGGPY